VHAGELYGLKKYDGIYFLSIVLQFLSYLTMMCTSYSYMLLYNERGKGNFNVGDVAKKMTAVIGKIIGAFFLFGFLILIFAVAVAFVINMIGSASPVFGVLLLLGLVVLILILFPNLSWQLCTLFLVIIAEEEIPLTAYGRTREVMKDNYWWTWLLMVCSNLMIMFVSAMFMIPELIYNLVLEAAALEEIQETSIVYIIVVITCTFCGTLVNAIGYVIGGFHFFSLEEKKDGAGLMERINDIGKTNAGI
jgi:MFS family permease